MEIMVRNLIYIKYDYWKKLFDDIIKNKRYKNKNYFNDLKWLRKINRNISKVFLNNCYLIELRVKINKIIKFKNKNINGEL